MELVRCYVYNQAIFNVKESTIRGSFKDQPPAVSNLDLIDTRGYFNFIARVGTIMRSHAKGADIYNKFDISVP